MAETQLSFDVDLDPSLQTSRKPPNGQLLKWIGNKQRSAAEIAREFPAHYNRYIEPFVGGGALLATMAPERGLAGDILSPLIDLWSLVKSQPTVVAAYYSAFHSKFVDDRFATYANYLAAFNRDPNALDLLCLCRSCYGGVVRFTKSGSMSTPVGVHPLMPPNKFNARLYDWSRRISTTDFVKASFEETMAEATLDDVVYCDPPYSYAQAILYGAQTFELTKLWTAIDRAATAGAKVALSIDGHKKSGVQSLHLSIPPGLFKRRFLVHKGGSMLKRFQRRAGDVNDELVADRLLLTW